MSKSFRTIKIYKEDYELLSRKSKNLSNIEGKRISFPEFVRRQFKINTDDVLIQDAKIKRKVRNKYAL